MKQRALLKQLAKDESGASGVEFALLAPVFIFFFLAAVTVFDLYRTYQNIVQANGIVADVVSRQTTINDAMMTKLYEVFTRIQTTRQSGNAIRISLLKRKGSGFETTWTKNKGDTDLLSPPSFTTTNLPDVADGDSIVYVEGTANYFGLTSILGFKDIGLSGTAFSRPRFASTISFTQ